VSLPQARDRAGDGHIAIARRRRSVEAAVVVQQKVQGQGLRCHTIIVDGQIDSWPVSGRDHVHQHVAATTQVAGPRQGHGFGESDSNGGVDGISSLAQDPDSDFGRRCALAYDHAVPADHRMVDLAIADDIAARASAGSRG
jgi:hypothetical protein